MVGEDFLQDPQIRDWLDGVEPAWTLLTFESLRALRREPSAAQTAILAHGPELFRTRVTRVLAPGGRGVVLWSLSVCANDWQSAEKLTRLCTIPEPTMFSEMWDRTPYAMEAKILRPLRWFGLLEHRSEKIPSSRFGEHHFYRKAELFDRLLAFDVQVDLSEGAWH